MVEVKISALTAVTSLIGTEAFPVVQGGATKSALVSDIKFIIGSTTVSGGATVTSISGLTLVAPVLGTPTSGTLTTCTGLPITTGVSGLGTGMSAFLATPSSANLATTITDETGTGGVLVFSSGPTFTGTTSFTNTANSGTLQVTGDSLLGTTGTAGSHFHVAGTYTSSNPSFVTIAGILASSNTGTQRGILQSTSFTPTGGSLTQIVHFDAAPSITSSSLALTNYQGIRSTLSTSAGFTGTIGSAITFNAENPTFAGGTVTNFYGFYSAPITLNDGSTTGTHTNTNFYASGSTAGSAGSTMNNRALLITVPSGGSSSGSTANRGIYITGNGGTASGGTVTNHAIFSDSTAPSSLTGSLTLADSPSAILKTSSTGLISTATHNLDYGDPVPHIDLDFVHNLYWNTPNFPGNLATCTRSTVGYIDDSSGTWTQVAANTLRRSDKGALVERAGTNTIRNNSMQGAVVGSPGTLPTNWTLSMPPGVSRSISSFGTTNGIDRIDIAYSGTSSFGGTNLDSLFENNISIAATQGQTWTLSVFLALTSGTFPTTASSISLAIYEYSAGGAVLTNGTGTDIKASVTATMQRFTFTYTTTSATCAFIRPTVTSVQPVGTVYNFTIRYGWPQLELASCSSSPIRTTSVAVTRSADIVFVNVPTLIGSEFTLAARGTPQATAADVVGTQCIVNVSDGTGSTRFILERGSGTGRPSWQINASATTITSTVWAQNTSGTIAAAWTAGAQSGAFNGGTVGTGTTATALTGLNTVEIGSSNSGSQWHGYIERVIVWAYSKLSDNLIQGISNALPTAHGYVNRSGTTYNLSNLITSIADISGSTGTTNFVLSDTPTLTGEVGIGSAATSARLDILGTYSGSKPYMFSLSGTHGSTSTSNQYLINITPTISPGGATVGTIWSINNSPTLTGSKNTTTYVGYYNKLQTDTSFSGSVTNAAYGYYAAIPSIGAGTTPFPIYTAFATEGLANASGATSGTYTNYGYLVATSTPTNAGATINLRGMLINVPAGTASAGTTSNIGMYISGNGGAASGTGTVTNWALYCDSTSSSYFAGNVAIGFTGTSSALLQVGTQGTTTGRQIMCGLWAHMNHTIAGYASFSANFYLNATNNVFAYSNTNASFGAMGIVFNYPTANRASIVSSNTTASTADATFTPRVVLTTTYDGNVGIDIANNAPTADLMVGTTAATVRVYNTFTDASNGEWADFSWSSNVLQVGTNKNGTGTARNMGLMAGGTEILRVNSSGRIGINQQTPLTTLHIVSDGTTGTYFFQDIIRDATASSGGFQFRRARGTIATPTTVLTGDVSFDLFGLGYDGAAYQNSGLFRCLVEGPVSSGIVPGAWLFYTTNVAGTLAERTRLYSNGDWRQGTGTALATTSTDGFLLIATCAGPPTGVPTNAGTGQIPIIYDKTNNRIYAYNSGWKQVGLV